MQKRVRLSPIVPAMLLSIALCAGPARAGEETPPVELVSVSKIWDQGNHNAFTDIIRFQDKWFCSFREGEGHVYGKDGTDPPHHVHRRRCMGIRRPVDRGRH